MTIKPALSATALYLGDNGRLFCGAIHCAGAQAYGSGCDLSGQPVQRIGPKEVAFLEDETGTAAACEGCGLRGSRLVA